MKTVAFLWVASVVLAGFYALSPMVAWGKSAEHIFAEVVRSVVVVVADDADGVSVAQGSGVVVGKNEVVTNCHVIEGGTKVFVRQLAEAVGGEETYQMDARVFVRDNERDLCLLFVDELSAPPAAPMAEMGAANELSIGEEVYAVGAPEGLDFSLSRGIVSQLRHIYEGQMSPLVQTDAAISQGSSGGGLFNGEGRLIGITTFKWKGENLNFALPVEWVEDLQERGRVAMAGDELEYTPESSDGLFSEEAKKECRDPLEFRLIGQECALTPRQREFVWDLHDAIGVDLFKRSLVVTSMMGFSSGLNAMAKESGVVFSETEKVKILSAVREYMRKEVGANFADLVEKRGKVVLSEYHEHVLPYFADFMRTDFGGAFTRLTYQVLIDETEKLMNNMKFEEWETIARSPESELQVVESLRQRVLSKVRQEFSTQEMSEEDVEVLNRFVAAAFPGIDRENVTSLIQAKNAKIQEEFTRIEGEWLGTFMNDEALDVLFDEIAGE